MHRAEIITKDNAALIFARHEIGYALLNDTEGVVYIGSNPNCKFMWTRRGHIPTQHHVWKYLRTVPSFAKAYPPRKQAMSHSEHAHNHTTSEHWERYTLDELRDVQRALDNIIKQRADQVAIQKLLKLEQELEELGIRSLDDLRLRKDLLMM